MMKLFIKYSCLIITLMITTTSISHATFSLHDNKPKSNNHFSIPKHNIPPKQHNIALLPEYCPPTTPSVPL